MQESSSSKGAQCYEMRRAVEYRISTAKRGFMVCSAVEVLKEEEGEVEACVRAC